MPLTIPPRARVLLVEDEQSIREHLTQALADEFEVLTAADGEEALKSVLRCRPDLIVTDIVMPTLDGVELVRLLRRTPSTSTIPILLTSGVAPDALRIEGFEVGADSYLAKPYSERELRVRIRALLQSSRRRDEAAQQYALERTTAERAALLESITDAFCAVDDQWRFTYVNHRAVDFFRKRLDDLLGKELWSVVPRGDGNIFEQEFSRAMAEQSPTTFEGLWEPDRLWLEVHVFPGPKGLAINFRDITERRVSEETMKEAERRKDEFVATLAHELRNPLAPIRHGIQVLRARLAPSPEAAEVLGMMDRQMTHMVRLLDDLLDVSRISRGKMELRCETVKLASVITAAIESAGIQIESRSHELIVDIAAEDILVDGDPTRLAQVFANLLSNSSKYTEPHGKIMITLKRDNDAAVVAIRDTGIGIPPHDLDHVFEMFSQVRLHQHQVEPGLGIGLSVVKTLVQMHGGSVEATSPGQGLGSTFTVRLPVAAATLLVSETGADHALSAISPIRILIVDDNEDAALSLAMLLTMDGHIVRTAFSGREAVPIAQAFLPQLIFMDLGMPIMDGFETSTQIRALATTPRPTIVALTGWGKEADKARSRAAGMDDHLVKPAGVDELRAVIESLGSSEPDPRRFSL